MTEKVAVLGVRGMDCQGCASTIRDALRSEEGVKDARVNSDEKKVMVTFDPSLIGEEKLKRTILDAGYRPG